MNFAFLTDALAQASQWILQWQTGIFQWGQPIFWVLATISLGITGALGILRRDFYGMLEDLTRAVLAIGVSWWLFQHAADYSRNVLVYTLGMWGGLAGNINTANLDPASIMNEGFQLTLTLFHSLGLSTWLSEPFSSAVVFICTLIVGLGFGFAAIIVLELLIETYVICIGETIFIPLAMTQFSWHFIQRYINDVLAIGVRLFFTYAILGIGLTMITTWVNDLNTHTTEVIGNMYYAIATVLETGLFLMMLIHIPKRVAGSVGSAITATVGEVLLGKAVSGSASSFGSAISGTLNGGDSSSSTENSFAAGDVSGAIDKMLLETGGADSSNAPTAPLASHAPTQVLA
jgi:P-type conjugative transfer protein TrbL